MIRRRARVVAVLAVLAAAGAACGSTVKGAQRATNGRGGEGEGLSATAATDAADNGAAAGADEATGGGGVASKTAKGRVGSSGRGSVSANGIRVVGPGVTDKTINVGVIEVTNSAAANAALGAGGISQGDLRKQGNVLADDINAHGGVAGRKINLVWHTYDGTSTETADAQEQNECDDFTKDNKIWAVFEGSGVRDLIRKCMNDAGVMLVDNPLTTSDQSVFDTYKYYVEIGAFRLDRMASVWPRILKDGGYFGGWNTTTGAAAPTKPKLGIVTYDFPTFLNSVNKVLVPKLASLGYPVDPNDVRAVTWLNSTNDAGAVAAGISSAVLRFRQDNVTHVMIVDERGLLTLLFAQQAQSQRYFPRYGFNSQNGPQALKDGANFPSQQMIGSVGMGWSTGLDIPASADPPDGPYSNERRRQCNALYKSKGVTFPDHNAEAGALDDCSTFWFFRDVMNATRSPISRDSFMATVDQLGNRYQAAGGFGLFFGPKQHDGVSVVRRFGYNAACDCMQYTTGNIDIG